MNNNYNNQFNQNNNNNINNQQVNLTQQQFQTSLNNNVNQYQPYSQTNNQYQQPQPVNPNINSQIVNNKPKKKKMGLIIGIVITVIVISIIILVLSSRENNSYSAINNNPSKTDVIVIQNDNSEYELYNSNGKRITNLTFKSEPEFLNNSAKVTNENGQSGVINSKGKMVVEYGKYNYIFREGYLYRVEDDNQQEYLLNYNGKVIYDLKDKKVQSYNLVEEIVVVTGENLTDVLSYKGESIIKFNDNNGYELSEKERNLVILFHNNTNYVIDIYEGKVINEIPSSTAYCLNDVSYKEGNKYIIGLCNARSDEFTYYEGKIKKYSKPISECSNLFFEQGIVTMCASSDGRYILDENGNKGIECYNNQSIEYIDYNNYVKKTNNGVEFYVNNKLVSTKTSLKTYTTASYDEKIYLLKDSSNKYIYYDSKGNKIFNKEFLYATSFDANKIAMVSDDGEKYYLINIKGNKISNDYKKINYDFMTLEKVKYYSSKSEDMSYILNIKGEEIISSKNEITIYDNYFSTNENDNIIYYTYSGKKIER